MGPDITTSALQNLPWPVLTGIFLFCFKPEIRNLIKKMSTFKAGSVEINFSESIKNERFNKQQTELITSMSSELVDFFFFISYADDEHFEYQLGVEMEKLQKNLNSLTEIGLITFSLGDDISKPFRHQITPLGRRLRSMMIEGSVNLIKSIE
jgi:hypothetical protein